MQQQPFALPTRTTLVVMGVSGSGKSDISQAVATTLGWRHIEADQFHPQENVERMRAGIPLSDTDRVHWLDALIQQMQAAQAAGEGFVLACSALKLSYRERLRAAVPGLRFAHLHIDHATALQRVGARPGHFMPTSLVDSQFATLEAPDGEPGVLCLDGSQSRSELVEQVCAWVRPSATAVGMAELVGLSAAEFDSATKGEGAHLTGEPIYSGGLARLFDRLTDGLMAVLMGFMVLLVFGNVVLRYAFDSGLAGAEELSRLAFVWLVFVGVASSMRRGELMSFSLMRDRFPKAARLLIDSLSWLLVAIASGLASWGAWQQLQFGWGIASPVVGYPLALAMLPVLACMTVLVLLALVQLVNVWRRPGRLPGALANVTVD
ncbi:TRAP transporter small permease subunit [Pseudomonas lalucatii]|uniref:Multifunctional fusion protein n=1 Tax=Pseudomonas lalucatii TaxID=1424203 RepID=A0ABS5PXM2_9PSED|nr:gluconokinase, GntK/IdnK-type [Pseudomonas lalucatii]MBS7660614.1 TRAP transporter small permease subunit [Pseudomonas lalucatii]